MPDFVCTSAGAHAVCPTADKLMMLLDYKVRKLTIIIATGSGYCAIDAVPGLVADAGAEAEHVAVGDGDGLDLREEFPPELAEKVARDVERAPVAAIAAAARALHGARHGHDLRRVGFQEAPHLAVSAPCNSSQTLSL